MAVFTIINDAAGKTIVENQSDIGMKNLGPVFSGRGSPFRIAEFVCFYCVKLSDVAA